MESLILANATTTLYINSSDEVEVTTINFQSEIITATEVINEHHNITLNSSLCEWYLPTVHQVPKALGSVGIALWVLGFVITFVLMGMFAKQFHFIYYNAHKSFRRHLYAINSTYVIIALLTSIGSGIPRAHGVCSAVKDVYMSLGVGHFVELTIAMYGGENIMAWSVRDRKINIRVVGIFKCFLCVPTCKTTKLSINILKWLVWQMKWSQGIYYLMKLIWKKSMENTIGIIPHQDLPLFMYIHIINVASFLCGVFSLLIIASLVTEDLQADYNYTIKAKTVRFTILATKLQRLFFEILEAFGVFPCVPPLVSQKFYKNVLKDFIYLVEVLILGTITFFIYTKKGEFEEGRSKDISQNRIHNNGDLYDDYEDRMALTYSQENFNSLKESAC